MADKVDLTGRERGQLKDIERALKASEFAENVKERVPGALKRLVGEFRGNADNRNRAGVKPAAAKVIKQTLRRVELAIQDFDSHEDGEVRNKAGKAVRAAQHLSSLEEITGVFKRLQGVKVKSGHRREDAKRKASVPRLSIAKNVELVGVVTSDDLTSVGRELGLCVQHPRGEGKTYHQALTHGASMFYRFEKKGRPLGLIEVDVASKEIAEVSGRSNKQLDFSRRVGLDMLRALGATADGVQEFASRGAFSPYVSEEEPVILATLKAGPGRRYRIAAFPDKEMLVVREQRSRGRRQGYRTSGWSLFKRRADEDSPLASWFEVSHQWEALSEGQLIELMCRHPRLAREIGSRFG